MSELSYILIPEIGSLTTASLSLGLAKFMGCRRTATERSTVGQPALHRSGGNAEQPRSPEKAAVLRLPSRM